MRKSPLTPIGNSSAKLIWVAVEVRFSMKSENLVPSKGGVAVGLVLGLIIGCLVGYLMYTQVTTQVIGSRQLVVERYEELLKIVNVEMGYDADGNIYRIEVSVKNIDNVYARGGNVTAGSLESSASEYVSLLPGEEKTVSLEMTPPIRPGEEETIVLVGVEDVTA